ncbi:unnamed protein product [Blepharisma stoltei]|uniref:Uncharacterized protein n=1 Tax=Blepharisma stoltei TaxID=1481888 RepID=A0AAU9JG90_9CILI|nr:unnamed protein product [Blepharisma stoltei]
MFVTSIPRDSHKSHHAFTKELSDRISKLKIITENNGLDFPPTLLSAAKELSDSTTHLSVLHCEQENPSPLYTSHTKSDLGIPPPQDLDKTDKKTSETFELGSRLLNSSFSESESESELDTTQLKKKSKSLIKGLKQQLKHFSFAQSKYLETSARSETETSIYKEDLVSLHKSATEVLNETLKTKHEIKMMRKNFEAACDRVETPAKFPNLNKRDFLEVEHEFIEEESSDIRSLAIQIKEIQTEIDSINQRITTGQEEFKLKEKEQTELMSTILKLRESLANNNSCVIDTDEKKDSCKCIVF